MSMWTHIRGTLTVSPFGRTKHEVRYILETVLDHLPKVTGGERDMETYVVEKYHPNIYSSHNEFGVRIQSYEHKEFSDQLIVVLDGDFRDRYFNETLREFMNWFMRLAKRVSVYDVIVSITADDRKQPYIFTGEFWDYVEDPSWCLSNKGGEPNWCEYLMWERAKNSDLPMMLQRKYVNDPENDAEVERRIKYHEEGG